MAGDADDAGNFTELNALINDTDDSIDLANDYVHVDGDEDVVISKSVQVNGNNHTINSEESSIVIDANDSSVVFDKVNFLNPHFEISNSTTLNVTFINCNFNSTNCSSYPPVNITQFDELNTTGEISPMVRQLAKSIVGDLKGYEAAYQLAKWVGTNIEHETASGFYQTPDTTLARRLGNCCSQTDLFLQMCVAVGVNEEHKLYYVHVGAYNLGQRHFFAIIDNILIDVDARPTHPWGRASIGDRSLYRVTEYPYLPLPRMY